MCRMDDGGVVNLFFHPPKENIIYDPSLYVDHNPVVNLVNLIALCVNPVEILFNPYFSNGKLD